MLKVPDAREDEKAPEEDAAEDKEQLHVNLEVSSVMHVCARTRKGAQL